MGGEDALLEWTFPRGIWMSRSYTDVDLDLTPGTEDWEIRLTTPRSRARGTFRNPLSEEEIEILGLTAVRGRRSTRSASRRDLERAKDFGGRLFDALFQDELLESYRETLAQVAGDETRSLRIRLRLQDSPELASIPWEFLYDRRQDRFLALEFQTPVVRYIELPLAVDPPDVTLPLRILVMISSPQGVTSLDGEGEWALLNQAMSDLIASGSVVLDRIEHSTLAALRWKLKGAGYHVFHFIGHGGVSPDDGRGFLILEDADGDPDEVDAETMAGVLAGERSLRLAVLNACEGGRSDASDVFTGTAQSLIRQDLSAVLAMQFEISDTAAVALTHDFYQALALGDTVEEAVTEARRGLRLVQRNSVEWATPVLYIRRGDGHLFRIRERAQEGAQATVPPSAPTRETAHEKGDESPRFREAAQALADAAPAPATSAPRARSEAPRTPPVRAEPAPRRWFRRTRTGLAAVGGLFILLVGIEMCSDDLVVYPDAAVPGWDSDLPFLDEGLSPGSPPLMGSLGTGQRDRHQVYLTEGLVYLLTGSCGEGCRDLDLSLSWMGDQISYDFSISTAPSIQVVPLWPGYYELEVHMVDCAAPTCSYEVYTYY
jgi:hypothetical protein